MGRGTRIWHVSRQQGRVERELRTQPFHRHEVPRVPAVQAQTGAHVQWGGVPLVRPSPQLSLLSFVEVGATGRIASPYLGCGRSVHGHEAGRRTCTRVSASRGRLGSAHSYASDAPSCAVRPRTLEARRRLLLRPQLEPSPPPPPRL